MTELTLLNGCREENDYVISMHNKDEFEDSYVGEWINSCEGAKGYNEYIVSDPDSWEMMVYHPNINEELNYITYACDIKISDNIIQIFLEEENAIADEQVRKDLLLHIKAPKRGAWPKESELYLNNLEVKCLDTTYKN